MALPCAWCSQNRLPSDRIENTGRVFGILEKGEVAVLAEEPTAPTLREEEG